MQRYFLDFSGEHLHVPHALSTLIGMAIKLLIISHPLHALLSLFLISPHSGFKKPVPLSMTVTVCGAWSLPCPLL